MSVILETSLLGLRYTRRLVEQLNVEELKALRNTYSYIYCYAPQKITVPGFSVTPKQTPLIDLTQPLDQVFARFRKTTRNEIRKTESMPELRFIDDDPERAEFYRFYKRIKKADGVTPDLRRDFAQSRFFNAFLADQLIVSVSCYDTGQVLRLQHIVSLRKESEMDHRIVGYASRRLIWNICRYGKAHGHRTLDLGGISYSEAEKRGVTWFKESFGGTVVDIYVYRYETRAFRALRKFLRYYNRHIE